MVCQFKKRGGVGVVIKMPEGETLRYGGPALIPHHQQRSRVRGHTDRTQNWESLGSQKHTP